MALIYMVMAAQFERFLDPLIVMFSVPVALVGVAPILWLTNTTFNIQSLMGLVMLIGIVVNNAIVFGRLHQPHASGPGIGVGPSRDRGGPLAPAPNFDDHGQPPFWDFLPLAIGYGAGGEIQAALARTVIGGFWRRPPDHASPYPVFYVTTHGTLLRVQAFLSQATPAARGIDSGKELICRFFPFSPQKETIPSWMEAKKKLQQNPLDQFDVRRLKSGSDGAINIQDSNQVRPFAVIRGHNNL